MNTRRARRVFRSLAVTAGALLAVAAVAAMATGSPLASTPAAERPTGSAPLVGVASSTSDAGNGAERSTSDHATGDQPVADSVDLGAGSGGSAPSPTSLGAPGVRPDSPTTLPGQEPVVVFGPFLQMSSFGSAIAAPLVCSMAGSVVTSASSNLAAIVIEIVKACQAGGNDFAAAMTEMNQRLATLAVINPAVRPLLESLATALDVDDQAMPFRIFTLAANVLRFFEG